jgi:lysophospholipase L1-like esterase
MKTLIRLFLVAAIAAFSPGSAFAKSAPLRIMPLGDSITDGTSAGTAGRGGYRGPLYDSLTTAGYNVDYIGTLSNNGALLADVNHEGHGGWRIDQHDANIEDWFNTMEDPDVVLMHIGTNDFGQSLDITNAINRFDALILKIATLRPYAHIIVTNLMARAEPRNTEIQTHFNPFVEDRVDAHALAGRRVTFLDMRAAVPITDMPDNLHPNQAGYDKMAAAWLPAIQAVIGVDGDSVAPVVVRARGVTDATQVKITFSKPVADSAANIANYAISGGLTVTAATLDAAKRSVTLTTGAQSLATTYTVTINGVEDRLTPTPNSLAANSTVNFQPVIPRGYLNHVPEAAGYTLAATLDIPNAAFWRNAQPAYSLDNRGFIGAFDRVAYYVELQSGDGQLRYLWASMDAFTSDVSKIAVPTVLSGAQFQQAVTNLNVVSNAAGIVNGTGLSGNLEFWPTNYQQPNGAGVPGASGTTYDFGDTATAGTYGSMQLHHAASGQTLFALNNWGAASGTPGNLDLGIGNDPAPVTLGVDWTFHHNAADYTVKSLQVLVRTSGDLTPPAVLSAAATFSGSKVTVSFSEPLAPASIDMANFALDGGVSILGFTLQPNQRDLVLLTTPQPAGTPLTLTLSGIRDTSPNANVIPANSTVAVAAAALPPEIVANVGAPAAGYHLVYSANLPTIGNFVWAGSAAYTLDDSAAFGPFTRVAYYLELQQGNGPVQYVWASMDAFTINRAKLGVPTAASGAVFQRNVINLDVRSNVAGVTTGASAAGGNIEFWPNDYSAPNGLPVANASATTYDTGDTRTSSGGSNYGSMQIHNHDSSQTHRPGGGGQCPGVRGLPACLFLDPSDHRQPGERHRLHQLLGQPLRRRRRILARRLLHGAAENRRHHAALCLGLGGCLHHECRTDRRADPRERRGIPANPVEHERPVERPGRRERQRDRHRQHRVLADQLHPAEWHQHPQRELGGEQHRLRLRRHPWHDRVARLDADPQPRRLPDAVRDQQLGHRGEHHERPLDGHRQQPDGRPGIGLHALFQRHLVEHQAPPPGLREAYGRRCHPADLGACRRFDHAKPADHHLQRAGRRQRGGSGELQHRGPDGGARRTASRQARGGGVHLRPNRRNRLHRGRQRRPGSLAAGQRDRSRGERRIHRLQRAGGARQRGGDQRLRVGLPVGDPERVAPLELQYDPLRSGRAQIRRALVRPGGLSDGARFQLGLRLLRSAHRPACQDRGAHARRDRHAVPAVGLQPERCLERAGHRDRQRDRHRQHRVLGWQFQRGKRHRDPGGQRYRFRFRRHDDVRRPRVHADSQPRCRPGRDGL